MKDRKTPTYDKNTRKQDLSESDFGRAFFLHYHYFRHAVSRYTEQLGDCPRSHSGRGAELGFEPRPGDSIILCNPFTTQPPTLGKGEDEDVSHQNTKPCQALLVICFSPLVSPHPGGLSPSSIPVYQ